MVEDGVNGDGIANCLDSIYSSLCSLDVPHGHSRSTRWN